MISEWRKAVYGAVAGAMIMGGFGFVTSTFTNDVASSNRFVKLETISAEIAGSVLKLVQKTDELVSLEPVIRQNKNDITSLSIEVKELTKNVTRLTTLMEYSINKNK